MKYRTLNHKGTILNNEQLENHLEKIASDHILQKNSNKDTYPIQKVKENFYIIEEVYHLLNEHIKLGIPIHPAGEWLLDNFYIIDETVKTIIKEMPLKKYTNFLGIANGVDRGFARIYVLADEIVNYTDNKIDYKNVSSLLSAYQRKKTLSMEEIWNIEIFMQIALIQSIKDICEKIYFSQMQKYRVENIIERLVENKSDLKYKNLGEYKTRVKGYGEMKYPFIEYMSYRLKKYGKSSYQFVETLEEQVNRMGTTIEEVIKKEHFDIALKKVSIANCIKSMKELLRMDFSSIFEQSNGIEEILRQDPIGIYTKMNIRTKEYYRNCIKEIAKKTKVSEIYIARKALELAKVEKNKHDEIENKIENKNEQNIMRKKFHIGYYLIDKGKRQLYNSLQINNYREINNNTKLYLYKLSIWLPTIIIDLVSSIYLYKQINQILITIIFGILILLPIQEIIVQIIQYILGKLVKPKIIPKLDFIDGIPEEYSTFVVIPTILKSKEKVKELLKKLEVYYLANKSENIYFALLGDCSAGQNKQESFDEEVIKEGLKQVELLNEKYQGEVDKNKLPKFHFIYRKRFWNGSEECYLGWERKRGILNQFNEYLLGNEENKFLANTLEGYKKEEIKYIITLDADTELVLDTGIELIGSMAHILNVPILNKNKDAVIDGYGLLQPRVGINIDVSNKNLFTRIFAGNGGVDAYTNAISDVYQDNFGEGIFTGKGIYDLKVFSQVLKNEIPENTVLSHDLLEGSYLRCGLVSYIMLMDGYPTSYNSFKTRLHRWIRGDFQIIRWIGRYIIDKKENKKKNPLNSLSRYKIADNLIRAITPITAMLSFILLCILNIIFNIQIGWMLLILGISLSSSTLINCINRVIYRKEGSKANKTFNVTIPSLFANFLRSIISILILPDKAYYCINAIIKTIYRVCISKKHLLEWTTSEDAEKTAKTDLISYYKNMLPNIIIGIFGIVYTIIYNKTIIDLIIFILSILWLIAPAIMWYISREIKEKQKIDEISNKEKEYLLDIGKNTWEFFKQSLIEKYHYLPPDNYQEDRKPKFVPRTSSTNIGLALLVVISSYDLKYENLEDTLILLNKIVNTIENLQKWNGHLYNWYNIETLEPLIPRYISTVDSGNFVGYIYVLKQFYEKIKEKIEQGLIDIENKDEKEKLLNLIPNWVNKKIEEVPIAQADFTKLYDIEKQIFSIGFNVEENKLTDSYYDLLASEARQASLVAIAKKDVQPKHWYNLSRTLTTLNSYKGLVSWSGTAFEYLMPNINIKKYKGSLLDESCKFMIMSQKMYAKKLEIPWGISETAFNLKDLNNNYQYKAVGIPWLGLKRGLEDDIVVSSYASILAINEQPKEVISNLKKLEEQGMNGKYGFYEAIDYTPLRLKRGKKYEIVKTYMAHHQALILLSINNLFNKNILQKRFHNNPEIDAVDILLQERIPESIIITKEEKLKPDKIKYTDYENYAQRVITNVNNKLTNINVISNEEYTIVMDEKGNGYSKYKSELVNRFKETSDENQGIYFYLKNIKNNRIWTSNYMNYLSKPDKYEMIFTENENKIKRIDGQIETTTKITIASEKPIEIRRIELKNGGIEDETIEITAALEPILSSIEQDIAHPAFNNLFLSYEYIEDKNIFVIKRKNRQDLSKAIYLAVSLYTKDETISELEFEIDKEKFQGRGNINLPIMVENSRPFSKNIIYVTDPFLALKRLVRIKKNETASFNLLITMSETKEQAINNIYEYQNDDKIKKEFELSIARADAEARYLNLKAQQIEDFQKMLGYLIYQNPLKSIYTNKFKNNVYFQSELWKYGISGDVPILLVKIKDVSDIYVLESVLKAYEFFRIKNIDIELVILNEEINSYENYLKYEIENAIMNLNLAYMINLKNGIFVIKDCKDNELLKFKANLIIDCARGPINRQLKDIEEEYLLKIKETGEEVTKPIFNNKEKNIELLDSDNLKYANEYGGFSNDGKEYIIRVNVENRLPTVWSHILANENFGTVVTDSLGGYTWSNNSRLNRITSWSNNQVLDIPSEIIYMQDEETLKSCSIGLNPMPDENDYLITYGFGYAKYKHTSSNILQNLTIFVPRNDNVKVSLLNLKNLTPKKKRLKFIYYIKPTLGEDELKTNGNIKLEYKDNSNILILKNLSNENFSKYSYISSNEKIQSYTGNRKAFIGSGNLSNPECLKKVGLNNENSLGNDTIAAIEIKIELEAFESKDVSFILGTENSIIECQDKSYQYSKINKIQEEYENIIKYWNELLGRVKVNTPLESFNILMNGWLVYQTIVSRLWARTGFYQSGGAFGFRDQLQDTIGLKYIDTNIMKNQIIKHSSHQFIEGDVEHWWHDETTRGIRTRFSDDLLWLVYVVTEYINFTGDYSILSIKTPYREGNVLEEGTDEKYDIYQLSKIEETIYEHCTKAIEKSLDFGENGLPKIGSGDWNDGLSNVGNKGKGESVWLGFFIYDILKKWIKVCKNILNNQGESPEIFNKIEKYKNVMEQLKKALNTNGWDGRWYKRAFMDNRNVLGTIQNEECKIDSISQSWSIISEAGDNDKKYISMESLENHLVDKENGIIKLLDPPFENGKLEPGYIKAYLPGTRENGGQYTHGAIWAIIAETMLGFGDKAVELLRMINPIEHSRTKEEARKYKVEPYVVSADIYGYGNLAGRGGWTWYTGSSSWMYEAGLRHILGLTIENEFLTINPCISSSWDEYSIKYKYGNSIYNIKVINKNGKNRKIEKLIFNGDEIQDKKIKLRDDGKINEIEAIF